MVFRLQSPCAECCSSSPSRPKQDLGPAIVGSCGHHFGSKPPAHPALAGSARRHQPPPKSTESEGQLPPGLGPRRKAMGGFPRGGSASSRRPVLASRSGGQDGSPAQGPRPRFPRRGSKTYAGERYAGLAELALCAGCKTGIALATGLEPLLPCSLRVREPRALRLAWARPTRWPRSWRDRSVAPVPLVWAVEAAGIHHAPPTLVALHNTLRRPLQRRLRRGGRSRGC